MAKKKETKKQIKKKDKKISLRKLIHWGFVFCIWGIIMVICLCIYIAMTLPDINQIRNKADLRPSITFLDSDGDVIDVHGDSRNYVEFEKIPNHLIDAVLSVEDRNFYNHGGFDIKGFSRAMLVNATHLSFVQGGSTITQQLAKNLFLNNRKTILRKAQEVILAMYIETQFTKDEILESYLNNVYFGAGNYGIESACKSYFGKSIDQIGLEEGLILAGLLKAPSAYNPIYHLDRAIRRAKVVENTMRNNNIYLPKLDFDSVQITSSSDDYKLDKNVKYFTDMVSDLIYGYLKDVNENIIVQTTLNMDMQNLLEQSISKYKEKINSRGADSIASVSLGKDGKIMAMMGGFSYLDSQFNRSVHSLRQTGSAFKTIVYLTAIEQGFLPESFIDDSKIKIGDWEPSNFDFKYHGEVTLREAFAHSYNISAVRLMQKIGIDNVIKTARVLGITADLKRNLTTALGSNSISLMEMTNAYNIISNDGFSTVPYAINFIKNERGNILYKKNYNSEKVISSKHLKYIKDLLFSSVTRGSGRNAEIAGENVYGKTGTTSDYKDAWFIGFSKGVTTGVWIGNDNFTPTKGITGGSLSAKVWHDYMINIEDNNKENENKGFWSKLISWI